MKQPTSDQILDRLSAAMKEIQRVNPNMSMDEYARTVRVVAHVYETAWRHGAEFTSGVLLGEGGAP